MDKKKRTQGRRRSKKANQSIPIVVPDPSVTELFDQIIEMVSSEDVDWKDMYEEEESPALQAALSRTSMLIQDYREFKAARTIQTALRGWYARRIYIKKYRAVIAIQTEWRRYHAKRYYFRFLEETLQARITAYYYRSAVLIQSLWRGWWVRQNIHDHRRLSNMRLRTAEDLLHCIAFKLHHFLRTKHIPGIYSLRNSKCLSKVEQLLSTMSFKQHNQRVRRARAKRALAIKEGKKSHKKCAFGTEVPYPGPTYADTYDPKCIAFYKESDADRRMYEILALYQETAKQDPRAKRRRAKLKARNHVTNDDDCNLVQCEQLTMCPDDSVLKSSSSASAESFDEDYPELATSNPFDVLHIEALVPIQFNSEEPLVLAASTKATAAPRLHAENDTSERYKRDIPYTAESEAQQLLHQQCCSELQCSCKVCPEVPKCEDQQVAVELHIGLGVPGNCCSTYTCVPMLKCGEESVQSYWRDTCTKCSCFGTDELCQNQCPNDDPKEDRKHKSCYSEYLQKPLLHGATWWEDGYCSECSCFNGERNCITSSCIAETCKNPVKVKGKCCPVCNDEVVNVEGVVRNAPPSTTEATTVSTQSSTETTVKLDSSTSESILIDTLDNASKDLTTGMMTGTATSSPASVSNEIEASSTEAADAASSSESSTAESSYMTNDKTMDIAATENDWSTSRTLSSSDFTTTATAATDAFMVVSTDTVPTSSTYSAYSAETTTGWTPFYTSGVSFSSMYIEPTTNSLLAVSSDSSSTTDSVYDATSIATAADPVSSSSSAETTTATATFTSTTSAPAPLEPQPTSYRQSEPALIFNAAQNENYNVVSTQQQMHDMFNEIDSVVVVALLLGAILCIALGLIIRHTKNKKKFYSTIPNSETSLSQTSTNTMLTV